MHECLCMYEWTNKFVHIYACIRVLVRVYGSGHALGWWRSVRTRVCVPVWVCMRVWKCVGLFDWWNHWLRGGVAEGGRGSSLWWPEDDHQTQSQESQKLIMCACGCPRIWMRRCSHTCACLHRMCAWLYVLDKNGAIG